MKLFKKIFNLLLRKNAPSLKSSSSNLTSKMIMSANATITLDSETKKKKEIIKRNIEEILKRNDNNPQKLLEYIENHGTKIHRFKNTNFLKLIGENEGLITELRGFKALFLNFMTGGGINFKTTPLFVLQHSDVEIVFMIYHFYLWYSLVNGMPGFDNKSQKIIKSQMNTNKPLKKLSLDEIIGLKEAIERDKEASEFAVEFSKGSEGSKKAFGKLNDGGANI